MNAEVLDNIGNRLTGSVPRFNFRKRLVGEFGIGVLLAIFGLWNNLVPFQDVLHMKHVFLGGADFEIIKLVVGFVSVYVVYLHLMWYRANKRLPHSPMDGKGCFDTVYGQDYPSVTVSVAVSKYGVSAPAKAILSDTFTAAKAANFVVAFKAFNWFPLFHTNHSKVSSRFCNRKDF